MAHPLRSLPSVNELLSTPVLKAWVDRANHSTVVNAARRVLDEVRRQVTVAKRELPIPSPSELAERIAAWIEAVDRRGPCPAINATGVLLHTGLGRAPWARAAIEAVEQVAQGYCTLEVDRESGERGARGEALERLFCELTGAEAALVVNNAAAATLLALTVVASGREVIVSRGELVEIGGSYRLPELMTACGTGLREVGTTNRTRLADYEAAVGPQTAAILKVHCSNYRVVGFTESARIEELVKLGRRAGLCVIDDVGSGAMLDPASFGVTSEPAVPRSIAAGADLVIFSGDKLLGGPQAGVLCGARKWIDLARRHPLARALRIDKATLAGLAATLELYRDPQLARVHIPLLAMLDTPLANLRWRAQSIAEQLEAQQVVEKADAIETEATVGGGSVPGATLPSWGVAVMPRSISAESLAVRLRKGDPAVFTRIQGNRLILDLRAVFPGEDAKVVEAFGPLSESRNTPSVENSKSDSPLDSLTNPAPSDSRESASEDSE